MSNARRDWQQRIHLRSDTGGEAAPYLDAPTGLQASSGRGQVTLSWSPVRGAVGYVVLRAATAAGPYQPVDTGRPDVMALPAPPFADTTAPVDAGAWYVVAGISVAGNGPGYPGAMGARSEPTCAAPWAKGGALASVRVTVDASQPAGALDRPWRPVIGSEHLSQLHYDGAPGDVNIGQEFGEALRLAHAELGVGAVRAHAILHDELAVYRELDGQPVHDFAGIDRVYDTLLALGLRPVVELSFMPAALAADPGKTVFVYQAHVSPPRDWDRWEALVGDLVAHLVDRYGRDEVRSWAFEVWNEPNLAVFWSGTREEYLRLYQTTARAVKSVDPGIRIAGPASAAAGWIDELLAFCAETGTPLDILTTHTYGNLPLDLRDALERHGFPRDLPIWWTEWGVNATHFNPLHDSPFAAAFLVSGMAGVMGRLESLAYWVVSDHFEELGRPTALLHGGFGLLSVGNLRKPRWWALHMLESLGDERVCVEVEGDGARSLVDGIATRLPGGGLRVLVWNATIDHAKANGDPLLDRRLLLSLRGLADGPWTVRHYRVDEQHSNIAREWRAMANGRDWPDEATWAELRRRNLLEELEPMRTVETRAGAVDLAFDLPMPAVSLLDLTPPAGSPAA